MIDFTALNIAGSTPHLLDWSSVQEPVLGGAGQPIDRLGSKHQIDVTTPPMEMEPDGRIWSSRLRRAKIEGARLVFPQLDFDAGATGAPRIAVAVLGGSSITVKGLPPGYMVREGQWLSVVHGARSYLYSAQAASADGNGIASIAITPMLRSPLSVDDAVNLAAPIIEGWIMGDEVSWSVDVAHHTGLSFSIREWA